MAVVIAELCQNHNGDVGLLREMVAAAGDAGADIVKIQTIFADEVTKRERFESGVTEDGVVKAIHRPYEAEVTRLRGLEIGYDDYDAYFEACEAAGVEPMTTAFTRAQVPHLASFPWRSVKVASYDCASRPLLEELAASFERVYVSTGATFDHEIEEAAATLRDAGVDHAFLHCVTVYPTPPDQLHLARMGWLRRHAPQVGFSDHSPATDGIGAAAVALLLGADVVERHFTILPADATKDGPVSIRPEQLRELADLAHGSKDDLAAFVREHVGDHSHMVGEETRPLSDVELLNRDYYRGRFASRGPDGPIYNWEPVPLP